MILRCFSLTFAFTTGILYLENFRGDRTMMIHSFLLIGQSNMAGRGFMHEVSPIENENLLVLRNGRWQNMYVPVNCDRPFSGINLAESFADAYSKDKNVKVGLIPCADGGTSLAQWQPGSLLFDHAVYQAKLASRTSTIAGVLWHQGESDCGPQNVAVYEERFTEIMNAFRKELDLYDVPFLLGGLGDFLENCTIGNFKGYINVNKELVKIAQNNKMTAFVSADGLPANPDNLHFSAAALREFGIRYYDEFIKIEDKHKVFTEKSSEDDAIRTEIEKL